MRLAVPGLVASMPLALMLVCGGCGYVGPLVPPSPQIPGAVTDLAVVERGNEIVVTFSTPARTVDSLAIDEFSDIDLRVGPAVEPFNEATWEASAKPYEVAERFAGGDTGEPRSITITKHLPLAGWQGKRIDVLVRTAVKKRGRYSGWSNVATLQVAEPLPPPVVRVEATAAGYRLTWEADRPGLHYQVLRQGPNEKSASVTGIAEKPEYVDGTAQWDTTYSYSVVAQGEGLESLPSRAVEINKPDTFAPAVPANVVALAGPDAVELTWTRNTETDLKGYYIFRSVDGGPFQRQGEVITLPSYSDRKVEHGKKYRYAVSSVDFKNNISDNSAPAEVAY